MQKYLKFRSIGFSGNENRGKNKKVGNDPTPINLITNVPFRRSQTDTLTKKKHISGQLTKTTEVLVLLLILLVGAILRLSGIEASPSGLWYDEALNGENALSILDGERPLFFFPDGYPQEPAFFYLQAALLKLLADGQPAIAPLRLASALMALLTLPVFWLWACTFLPRRWALLAVLILALFPWHIHFSRLGFRTILAPLMVCLVGLFYQRWLKRGSYRDAILTGLAVGASLYTYTAVNVLPILVAVAAVLSLTFGQGVFVRGQPEKATSNTSLRQRFLSGAALGFAAGLLVFLPLSLFYLREGSNVLTRVAQVGPGGSEEFSVIGNIGKVAGMFGLAGDPVFKHGPVGRPVFPLLFSVFFWVGLLHTAVRARVRQGFGFYLLLVLVGFLASSVLSQSAPNKLRTLGAVPIVVIFFVQGLRIAVLFFLRLNFPAFVSRVFVGATLFFWLWTELSAAIYGWHLSPPIYPQFSGQFTQAAQWAVGEPLPPLPINETQPSDEAPEGVSRRFDVPLYIPTAIYNHATVRYLTRNSLQTYPLEDLTAALLRQPGKSPTAYLLITRNAPQNERILATLGIPVRDIAILRNPVSGSPFGVFIEVQRRAAPFTDEEQTLLQQYLTDR
jgi:hypothetical protein